MRECGQFDPAPGTISERAAILRERAAFERGFVTGRAGCPLAHAEELRPLGQKFAREAFPLPRVTRPRVVRWPDGGFVRLRNGAWQWGSDGLAYWRPLAPFYEAYATEKVHILADLLANPTETVEDDA